MYTTIIHPLRKALNLSMNEYAVLDSIMKLSNNTEFSGWCIISREKLGDALDLSKPTIIKIYDTLEIKGLIVKNKIGHARPVQLFIDLFSPESKVNIQIATENKIFSSVNIFTNGKETLPDEVKKIYHDRLRNFTEIGKETLPYSNNNINNDNNINIDWKSDFEIYKDSLRKSVKELLNDKEYILQQEKFNPNVNIKLTIEKACINYWATEAGWKHKKKSRAKDLDWKSTITNAISSPLNKVYKGIKNEAFITTVNSKYPDAETYKREGYDR